MDEIAVLIPCFNEEITVGKVVRDFKKTLPQATVYVYDNNSTDKTVEKAKEGNNLYRIIEPYCEEGAGIHVQFTLDDNNNAVSLLPVGSLFDLGNGYQLYYAPEQYPNYCFFTNEGDSFNFGFLFTDNGSDLYVGSGSFVWNKGYPGK